MAGSRTRRVRRREVEEGVRVRLREGGTGGVKCKGEVGLCAQSSPFGPLPAAGAVPTGVFTPVLPWL